MVEEDEGLFKQFPSHRPSICEQKQKISWRKTVFSPPVRWGLLDFMSVSSPPPPPSPSSPSPPPPVVLLLVGSQLRSCEFSVACWTPTAILRVQCGVPDPNREPASSVWRPGPQPRSCEISVAARTPTAILWVQCGGPDPNRDPVSSVWRAGPQVLCQKICQKEWQKNHHPLSYPIWGGTSKCYSTILFCFPPPHFTKILENWGGGEIGEKKK